MGSLDAGMLPPRLEIDRRRRIRKQVWERLRERPNRGISTLPDGGLVAEPMAATGMKDASESSGQCPVATRNVAVNLRNRQKAIDTAGYGPLNPREPNAAFWKKKADRWDVSAGEAKKQRCGNCAAFIKTPRMLECIDKGLGNEAGNSAWEVIDAGALGYCEAFDFKCASERTCDAWIVGGPITTEKKRKDLPAAEVKKLTPFGGKKKKPAVYDPNAGDGDGDGDVQDGTDKERPAPLKKIDWQFPLLGEVLLSKVRPTDKKLTDKDGRYIKQRRILHKKIAQYYLKRAGLKKPEGQRTVFFMGGGPSSGKTTALKSGVTGIPKSVLRIDTDEIKEFIPEYRQWMEQGVSTAASMVHEESRHVSKLVNKALIDHGGDFIYDTTGDGNYDGFKERLEGMRANGHRIVGHYMTNDIELAKKLNLERFKQTGRMVPQHQVEYVHRQISRNIPRAMKEGLFDEFYLYDTNDLEKGPRLIASQVDGKTTIHDWDAFNAFVKKGTPPPPPPKPEWSGKPDWKKPKGDWKKPTLFDDKPSNPLPPPKGAPVAAGKPMATGGKGDKMTGDLLSKLNQPGSGFSISISNLSDVKSGWAVSRAGEGIKIPANRMFDADGNPTEEGKELLLAYLMVKKDQFLEKPTAERQVVLGGWHDDSDGMLYFDVTDVHSKESTTLEQAKKFGLEQNQKAIADLDEIAAAIENDDWEKRTTIHDSGGSGTTVMPLSKLDKPLAYIQKNKGKMPGSKPISPDVNVVAADDGVQMMIAEPVEALGQYHRVKMDWSQVRAVDPAKRKEVSDFYESKPEITADQMDDETRRAYEALRSEVREQYRILTEDLGVKVEFVDDDPYENFVEMRNDFVQNKRLKILKTSQTGGHPFFSDEENDMFRAIHDAFGHLATGRGFDRHGEEAAYQAHKSMFSEEAAKAAATELRGQNAFLIQNGFFGPQKLLVLPEVLRKQLWVLLQRKAARPDLAQVSSDQDNAYDKTWSHHVSCGRALKASR